MDSVASGAAVHGFASAGSGAALFMGEKTALWKPGLVFTFLTWGAFEAISDARIRAPCFSQELIGWGFRVCRGSSGPARWANVTSAVCVCVESGSVGETNGNTEAGRHARAPYPWRMKRATVALNPRLQLHVI